MSNFKYKGGLRNVGSYQVSGTPYVTSSTVANSAEEKIEFPMVTNNVTVKMNNGKVVKKAVKITGNCALQQSEPTEEFDDGLTPAESGAQTYVLWVRADPSMGSDGNFRYIFYHAGSSTRAVAIRYKYSNDKIRMQVFRNDGTSDHEDFTSGIKGASSEYPLQHIVVSTSGLNTGTIKFYLNSVEKKSLTLDANLSEWNKIGYSGTGGTAGSNFTYVESAVFNTEFNQDDVNEAYSAGKYLDLRSHSKSANLKIYHTFGDDLGDVVTEQATTINDIVGDNSLAGELGVGVGEGFTLVEETFNAGPNLRMHFNSITTNPWTESRKHMWNMDTQDEQITLNIKTKELWLSAAGADADFGVFADLTGIPVGSMFALTGSGIDE